MLLHHETYFRCDALGKRVAPGIHPMYSISPVFVRARAQAGPLWLSDAVAKMQSVVVKS